MSALIAASETDGRAVHIPSAVNEMIEPVLAQMDAARDAVPKAVDTPDEVEKLSEPCSDSL
jgi:hypothetical protein